MQEASGEMGRSHQGTLGSLQPTHPVPCGSASRPTGSYLLWDSEWVAPSCSVPHLWGALGALNISLSPCAGSSQCVARLSFLASHPNLLFNVSPPQIVQVCCRRFEKYRKTQGLIYKSPLPVFKALGTPGETAHPAVFIFNGSDL